MYVSLESVLPSVPSRWSEDYKHYQRRLARRITVVTAAVVLLIVPFLQLIELMVEPVGPERLAQNALVRMPAVALAALALLLRWLRPEGSWPRPMALLLGIALIILASLIFLSYYLSGHPCIYGASAGLIMSVAAVGLLATKGLRDLLLIYGLPLLLFIGLLSWLRAPVFQGTLHFLYPLLMMIIGGVMSEMLYRGSIETFMANRQLQENAMTDPLTGLLNRRAMDGVLQAAVARADRHGEPYAVIMNDLDHFKRVNDVYGHDVGDEVLRELSERLQSAVRTEDEVCRWGGEEFLILVQRADESVACRVAEKIRARVAETPFTTSAGTLVITLSLGVAAGSAGDAVDSVVQSADKALYQAKANGRNRVEAG